MALACDAECWPRGPGGARSIPAAQFLRGPFSTALAPDEILTEVRLPVWPGGHAFTEFSRVHANFAVVGVAALVELDGDRIGRAALAVTGVAPTPSAPPRPNGPWPAPPADATTVAEAAQAALDGLAPVGDLHASGETRISLARTYLRRALDLAVSRARNER